jgi:hypothetical protein
MTCTVYSGGQMQKCHVIVRYTGKRPVVQWAFLGVAPARSSVHQQPHCQRHRPRAGDGRARCLYARARLYAGHGLRVAVLVRLFWSAFFMLPSCSATDGLQSKDRGVTWRSHLATRQSPAAAKQPARPTSRKRPYLVGQCQPSANAVSTSKWSELPHSSGCFSAQLTNACTIAPRAGSPQIPCGSSG